MNVAYATTTHEKSGMGVLVFLLGAPLRLLQSLLVPWLLLLSLAGPSRFGHAFVRFTGMSDDSSSHRPRDTACRIQQDDTTAAAKYTLYDMPVSNNGARCRIILYKKEIPESVVRIAPPSELGGLTSPLYRAIHPAGKMPALHCTNTMNHHLAESDTIARFLLHEFSNTGPSFLPHDARSNYLCRVHDMYVTTIQGCLYKAAPPFGRHATRSGALRDLRDQLEWMEGLVGDTFFLCHALEMSLADATIFPTMVFFEHMFPKFDVPLQIPPKLNAWYQRLKVQDAVCQRVYQEIKQALLEWDARKRWDGMLGAGWRDATLAVDFMTAQDNSNWKILYETNTVVAYRTNNMDAANSGDVVVIVLPKERSGLTGLRQATEEHAGILGQVLLAAACVEREHPELFPTGARIMINDESGRDGSSPLDTYFHVSMIATTSGDRGG